MSWKWPKDRSGRRKMHVLKLETEQQHYRILLESLAGACENLDGELEALDGRLSAQRAASEQVERDVAALENDAARWRAEAERSRAARRKPGSRHGRSANRSMRPRRSARPPWRQSGRPHSTRWRILSRCVVDLLCDRSEREALVNRYEAESASLQNQGRGKNGDYCCAADDDGEAQLAGLGSALRRKNWNWKQNALPRTGRAGRRTMRCCSWSVKWVDRLRKKATSAMEEKRTPGPLSGIRTRLLL